jgi:integrase/recombinase XerD
MRTPPQKAKSDVDLQAVIQATQKLWRRHHLSYDQTRYVAKQVRHALELERPQIRTRIIERLSRDEERRLIDTAYRLTGTLGLLIKTLFQNGARVSEFVAIEVEDFFFDEQMILIRKAKGGKRRYVPILPELAQELGTHLRARTRGYLFETNRHTAFSPRRIQQLVKETADLAGITKRVTPHTLRRLRRDDASGTWHAIRADSAVPWACPTGHDPNLCCLHHRHDQRELSASFVEVIQPCKEATER